MDKTYGAISSSVDPGQISTTVLGLAKVFAGLLVFAGMFTVDQQGSFLAQTSVIVQGGVVITPLVFAMWHAGEVIFGIFQKVLVHLFKKA